MNTRHTCVLRSRPPREHPVYFFYAEGDSIPLYIGKSIDIRSRLLSHLRAPEEARMLRQAQRIEYPQTAGEIGALLLESRLIKELQPLKHKRLRRQQRLCSLRIRDETGRLQGSNRKVRRGLQRRRKP